MNKGRIVSEFRLKPFGQKGWYSGDLFCPQCNKNDKFGVLFSEEKFVTHCFYCSESWSLRTILKGIKRDDLLEREYYGDSRLDQSLNSFEEVEIDSSVELPILFRSIDYDEYLYERGFIDSDYTKFHVGVSPIDPKVDNKVVFLIYQNNELSGWVARSRYSKEWHKNNLERHKELGEPLVLRYRNSNNDFSKMLGGLDEITDDCDTIILVEGLFDKHNIDRLLHLDFQKEVKCCFTFGSSVNLYQINLIPRNVKYLILMYDYGTLDLVKELGEKILTRFERITVCKFEDPDKDPGNITLSELNYIIDNMEDFNYFYNQLPLRKL